MGKKISDQQVQTDHKIEEILPDELCCPRCSAPAKQVITKRGIHYKCQNQECAWDSNQPFDFSKVSRERYIVRCAHLLKMLFPQFNFVSNFPYSTDAVFTGVFKQGTINYDLSVYFFGNKIRQLRVELNQHLTQEKFMSTNEDVYVIGRSKIVEYLAKKDGVVVHFLVDEPKKKIGMSRLKIIQKVCPKKNDKFGNIQYTIPKELRPAIVTFEWNEMNDLLMKGYHRVLYRNVMIK